MSDEVYAAINPVAGYPLTLLIILRTEQIVTHDRFLELTDLSSPTLRKHLKKLSKLGYVENTGDYHNPMFVLTEKATELYFLDFSSEKFLQMEAIINIYKDSNYKGNSKKTNNRQSEKILQINEEAYQLLKENGIGEPNRTRLASLDLRFVSWRVLQYQEKKKNNPNIHPGYLVRLLENYEKPPKEKEKCPGCGHTLFNGHCVIANCEANA